MARTKTTDTADAVNEGPTAGCEAEPVARPYEEARDPAAFDETKHHGYTDDDPAAVVDLTGDVAAAGAPEAAPEADAGGE